MDICWQGLLNQTSRSFIKLSIISILGMKLKSHSFKLEAVNRGLTVLSVEFVGKFCDAAPQKIKA